MSQAIRQMIQRGNFPQALAALPEFRALRNDPDRLYLRALAHAALGQAEEARHCAERGIELEPEAPRFLLLLGSILSQSDPQRAQSLFTEVIALNPNLPEGHAGLASLAVQRKAWAQAESLFRTALRANPEHTPSLLAYARMLADLQSHDEALKLINRVLAREPNNPDAQALAGRTLLGRGNDDFARRALDNALAIAPRHVLALRSSAQLHFRQGQYEQSWNHNAQLLSLVPDDQAGLLLAAELLLRNGQMGHAQQLLARLVTINPLHERALLKLADLEAQNNPLGAARRLHEATRLLPEAVKLWGAELALLGGQGQLETAFDEARVWTELAATEPQAWNQRAALAEYHQQLAEATEAARQALQLEAGLVDSSLVLARAELLAEQPQAALDRLTPLRAAVAGVKRNEMERFVGRALLALGRNSEALSAFRDAAEAATLDLYPPPLEADVQRGPELEALPEAGSQREIWFLVGVPGSGVEAIGRFFASQPDCYLLNDRFGPEPRSDLLTERARWGVLADSGLLEHARSRYWRGIDRLRIPASLQVVDWLPQLDVRMYDALRLIAPGARFLWVQRDPRDALLQSIVGASMGATFADPQVLAGTIAAQTRHLAQILKSDRLAVHSLGFEEVQLAPDVAMQKFAAQLGRAPFAAVDVIERILRDRGGLPKYLPSHSWQALQTELAAALALL